MRLERPERDGKFTFGIADKTDRLDILINNAARGIMTQQLAKKGSRSVYGSTIWDMSC